MRLRCANCRKVLLSGDKQATSRVYGTHGACTLCESCTEHEAKVIEKKGTNHVPELWTIYIHPTETAGRQPQTKSPTT